MTALLTFGHGTLDRPRLAALLRAAEVSLVVDVRRFPGSRAHPHVARAALATWLPEEGVDYRWEERLGGRRSGVDGETDAWWQVDAFRAYAAHLRGDGAQAALADVLTAAGARRTAVMCSETLWWRCHRRLLADTSVLAHRVEVSHLDPVGRGSPHLVAAGAVLGADGLVRYPET